MNLTPLLSTQVVAHQRLSEHHPSEVLDSEEPPEVPEVGDFDAYWAYIEGKGDCYLSDLTGAPDLGHHASLLVAYDQLQGVCSAATLSLPTSLYISFTGLCKVSSRYLIILLMTHGFSRSR